MKKYIVWGVTLALFMSVVGCTKVTVTNPPSSSANSQASSSTVEKETTDTFPLAEKVTLSILASYKWTAINNDMPVIQKLSEMTNIELEWETYIASSYNDVINIRLAAGISNLPDIMIIPDGNKIKELGANGVLLPMQDIIADKCPALTKYFDDNKDKGYKEMITAPDGNMYGLATVGAPYSMGSNYLIDKRALDKIGMSYPTNIDEFYQMLVKAKEAGYETPYTTGYKPIHQLSTVWGCHLTNYNADGFWAYDGVVKNDWISDNLKAFYTFMNKLYKEKLLDQEFDIQTSETQSKLVAAEKIMCITVDTGSAAGWNTMLGSVEEPYWTVAPIMTGPNGDNFLIGRRIWDIGSLWCVNAQSENTEAAVMLLAWNLTNDDARKLLEYGVEGITYEMENGKMKKIFDDSAPEYGKAGCYYPLPFYNGLSDSYFNDFIPSLPKQAQELRNFDLTLEELYVPPFYSNSSLTISESAEYTKISPDLTTYLKEMMIKFVKGEIPLTEWDEYVATANEMGMTKLIAIKQAQYDRLTK